MKKPAAADFLPLTPRVLLLLWGLADGPQHGYRLLTITQELGRGRVSIGPASLYDAIHSLNSKGLVRNAEPPAGDDGGDSRRRYFALTSLGRQVLEAEAGRVVELAEDLRRARVAPVRERS